MARNVAVLSYKPSLTPVWTLFTLFPPIVYAYKTDAQLRESLGAPPEPGDRLVVEQDDRLPTNV